MIAVGFVLFFIGVCLVAIIGKPAPHPVIAIPILVMVGGGFGLMVAGVAIMLWRIAP